MEICRGAFLLFFFTCFLLSQSLAANLTLEKGDSVVLDSSNTEYSWDENITYNSTGLEKQGRNLSFLRSAGLEDIFYSVYSNTSERINLSFFSQSFYGDPDSGENVLSFNASAVSGSEVAFLFGGAPSAPWTAYDILESGQRFLQTDSRDLVSWNFTGWSTKTFDLQTNETDLRVGQVYFNISDTVENQKVKFTAEVSNKDTENITEDFRFREYEFNGTQYVNVSNRTRQVEIANQSVKEVNFTFEANIGNFNYSLRADPDDSLAESNESNNFNSSTLNVSSYQIFYGDPDFVYKLGEDLEGLREWRENMPEGNLYYADEEAEYDIRDLLPLNETGDLEDATEALKLTGHQDSVSEIYDENGDGEADKSECFNIASEDVCQVPVVNSTNSSNFRTGILYDSLDGQGYDGSQDLVFITRVFNSTSIGSYGNYKYEARVPSTLSDQVIGGQFIRYRLEIK
jgi:hypothetical protein